MKPARLMGRLANGFEADQGSRIHAVPDDCGHYDSTTKALCGAKPGRRSGGWDTQHMEGRVVTCPRCLKKLAPTRTAEKLATAVGTLKMLSIFSDNEPIAKKAAIETLAIINTT